MMKLDSRFLAREVHPGVPRVIRPYERWLVRGHDQMYPSNPGRKKIFICEEALPGITYPTVTFRSPGASAVATLRRTRLVAPSAPTRKSACSVVSRVVSVHPRA